MPQQSAFQMTQTTQDKQSSGQSQPQASDNQEHIQAKNQEKILCPHCKRTATNGIKCKGICVADDDY